ncbi:hypothetical protein FRC07_006077 [Ceratobasidium sp. 392]|nr:hypothetical protein FRC07_006077 [Ceratobasidium sp. 392]
MSSFKSEPRGHALYIPELLDLIGGLLDMNDWLALMRTCRSVFPMIASRVWREVEAQVIMDLIVETSHNELDESDVSRSIEESTVDFTRFDMYAPFIRQLRVYGRTARYFKGERRRICTRRAQEGVLLPNVTSVTLLTSDLTPDSAALFWLDMFLMPSLRELGVKPAVKTETAWVSYPVASDILEKLITTCSVVERLELYPRDIAGSDNSSGSGKPLPFNPHNIGLCTRLRRVTSGTCILSHGGFAALGALPQLQSLSLRQYGEPPKMLQLSVPDKSFPSLTRLSLLDMDTANLTAIMGVEQLAKGLRSLRISQIFPYAARYDDEICQRWINQTLARIFEYTPQLKSLSYDVTQGRALDSRISVYQINPHSFLQTMSRLQLRNISLLGIQFEWGDWFASVAMAFQQVTVFRMPHQRVGNDDLPWLASLSFLRQLEFGYISLSAPLPELHDSVSSAIERLDATVTRMRGFDTPLVSAEQAAR